MRVKADKPALFISGSNWNLECWFLWREETERTRRKTLGAGTRTNNNRVWARPRHCTNPAMKFKMSRPKMIKGSICPLKRRAIFATNFTEVFMPKKIMQEFRCKFDYKRHNFAINTFSRRITLTAILWKIRDARLRSFIVLFWQHQKLTNQKQSFPRLV